MTLEDRGKIEDREFALKRAEDRFREEKRFWDRVIRLACENKIKAFDEYIKETDKLLQTAVENRIFDEISKPMGALLREV